MSGAIESAVIEKSKHPAAARRFDDADAVGDVASRRSAATATWPATMTMAPSPSRRRTGALLARPAEALGFEAAGLAGRHRLPERSGPRASTARRDRTAPPFPSGRGGATVDVNFLRKGRMGRRRRRSPRPAGVLVVAVTSACSPADEEPVKAVKAPANDAAATTTMCRLHQQRRGRRRARRSGVAALATVVDGLHDAATAPRSTISSTTGDGGPTSNRPRHDRVPVRSAGCGRRLPPGRQRHGGR